MTSFNMSDTLTEKWKLLQLLNFSPLPFIPSRQREGRFPEEYVFSIMDSLVIIHELIAIRQTVKIGQDSLSQKWKEVTMQRLLATIILLVLLLASVFALAGEANQPEPSGKSFGHRLLFYIPNRIFDIFDLARIRLRVGSGIAVDARVTKYGDLYAGGYSSLFVGLRSADETRHPLAHRL